MRAADGIPIRVLSGSHVYYCLIIKFEDFEECLIYL